MDLLPDSLPNKKGIKSISFISTGSYSVENYQINLSLFPTLEHLEITRSVIGLNNTDYALNLRSFVSDGTGGYIEGYHFLRYMQSLETLSITNIYIGDISFIYYLPNLKTVDFSYSTINDSTPLFACENITEVKLDNTWIRNG